MEDTSRAPLSMSRKFLKHSKITSSGGCGICGRFIKMPGRPSGKSGGTGRGRGTASGCVWGCLCVCGCGCGGETGETGDGSVFSTCAEQLRNISEEINERSQFALLTRSGHNSISELNKFPYEKRLFHLQALDEPLGCIATLF